MSDLQAAAATFTRNIRSVHDWSIISKLSTRTSSISFLLFPDQSCIRHHHLWLCSFICLLCKLSIASSQKWRGEFRISSRLGYCQISQDHHWQVFWTNIGIYWSKHSRRYRRFFYCDCCVNPNRKQHAMTCVFFRSLIIQFRFRMIETIFLFKTINLHNLLYDIYDNKTRIYMSKALIKLKLIRL